MPKTVLIELDKARRLKYDINAFAAIEEALGTSLGQAFRSPGLREIRALLWAGLRWEDRKLTLEGAGDIIQTYLENGGDLDKLTDAMREALEGSGLIGPTDRMDTEGNGEAEAAT